MYLHDDVGCLSRQTGKTGRGLGSWGKICKMRKVVVVCVCRVGALESMRWRVCLRQRCVRHVICRWHRVALTKGVEASSGQLRLVALLSESVTTEVSVLHLQRLIRFSLVSLGTSAVDPSLTSWTGAIGQRHILLQRAHAHRPVDSWRDLTDGL